MTANSTGIKIILLGEIKSTICKNHQVIIFLGRFFFFFPIVTYINVRKISTREKYRPTYKETAKKKPQKRSHAEER